MKYHPNTELPKSSEKAAEAQYVYIYFLSHSSMILSHTMVAKIVNISETISISLHDFFYR